MPGLLRGVARTAVIAGTATAVSNRVSRRQAGRWAAQSRPSVPAEPAPTVGVDTAGSTEVDMDRRITRLKELGELKDQGVLTQAEFDAQKAQLLSG